MRVGLFDVKSASRASSTSLWVGRDSIFFPPFVSSTDVLLIFTRNTGDQHVYLRLLYLSGLNVSALTLVVFRNNSLSTIPG